MTSQDSTARPSPQPATAIDYEYSTNLPIVLDRLGASLVVSTYQAGKVFTVGSHEGRLQVHFHNFEQAMGIARTPTGLAIGTKRQVWTLPAAPSDLAARVKPERTHDIAFLARQAHFTGPVMGHDLAWCAGSLWMVNTLFNCLCTLEPGASFVPRWRPPFISGIAAGDRCHLNGLAADDAGPRFVTVCSKRRSGTIMTRRRPSRSSFFGGRPRRGKSARRPMATRRRRGTSLGVQHLETRRLLAGVPSLILGEGSEATRQISSRAATRSTSRPRTPPPAGNSGRVMALPEEPSS